MESQDLQKLQDEITQEIREGLKNSNFSKVLEKYGITEQQIVQVQCIIDLNKIQDTADSPAKALLSLALPSEKPMIVKLDWCPPLGFC